MIVDFIMYGVGLINEQNDNRLLGATLYLLQLGYGINEE